MAATTGNPIVARRPSSRQKLDGIKKTLRSPQFRFAMIVLLPILIWYAWFGLGPILRAFWMSTVKYKLLNPSASKFIGLKNFQDLFEYDRFWIAVRHTIEYALLYYVGMLPVSLFVATCLTSVARGRNLYQAIIFLPVVVSMVAIALLFKMLMNPEMGEFNRILRGLGFNTFRFLGGSESALLSVVAVDIWKGLGFYVVILSAGMLNIPEEMYDAAKVDGAGAWQRFRHVTIPLLGHTLALVSVLMLMNGLQVYVPVTVLPRSAGGPGTATYVLNILVTTEAFSNLRFGFATAGAFSLFVLIIGVTLIQLKLLQPKWQY